MASTTTKTTATDEETVLTISIRKLTRYLIISVVVTLAISLFIFWLVSRPALFPELVDVRKPDEWRNILGQLGSFYGGILGPIATVGGLYFIYGSYAAQQQEAQRQRQQTAMALVDKLYSDLLDDINSIQYRKHHQAFGQDDEGVLYQGIEAIFHYGGDDDTNLNSVLNHVNLIIATFLQLTQQIETTIDDEESKKILLNKVHLLAHAKIVWPVYEGIYKRHRNLLILSGWGYARVMFHKYHQLVWENARYLSDKELILADTNKLKFTANTSGNAPAPSPVSPGPLPKERPLSVAEIAALYPVSWIDWQYEADKLVQALPLHSSVSPTPQLSDLRILASFVVREQLNALPIPPEFKPRLLTKSRTAWDKAAGYWQQFKHWLDASQANSSASQPASSAGQSSATSPPNAPGATSAPPEPGQSATPPSS